MSPWVPGEHLRSGHLLAARRRANNFVFPLHLQAVPVTFNSYQMYVFQLSSVDCFPIARTNSIAVKFLGGFLVLYLNKSVLGFLYYKEEVYFPHRWGSTKSSSHTNLATPHSNIATLPTNLATPHTNLAAPHPNLATPHTYLVTPLPT